MSTATEGKLRKLRGLRRTGPSLVLASIGVPKVSKLSFTRGTRRVCPGTIVIVLAKCSDFTCTRGTVDVNIRRCLLGPISCSRLGTVTTQVTKRVRTEGRGRRRVQSLGGCFGESIPRLESGFTKGLLCKEVRKGKIMGRRTRSLGLAVRGCVIYMKQGIIKRGGVRAKSG